MVVIYEQNRRFGPSAAQEMIAGLVRSCLDVGTDLFCGDLLVCNGNIF